MFHNITKHPDDIRQLVTYYSCETLPNDLPSHAHTVEVLTQTTSIILASFEVSYYHDFSMSQDFVGTTQSNLRIISQLKNMS